MNRIEALEWLRVNMNVWGEGPTPDGWCWGRTFEDFIVLGKPGSTEYIPKPELGEYVYNYRGFGTPAPKHINCKIIRSTPPLQGALSMLGQLDRLEPCGQSFGELMNDLKGDK